MLIYACRECGQLTIGGLVNEFNEHFCREKCYKDYCEKRHYAIHLDRLELVKITSDN